MVQGVSKMQGLKKQSGIAMLMVLMLLIIIGTVAASAIRLAGTSINNASFAMANSLIQRENDVALFHVVDYGDLVNKKNTTGIFGYTIANPNKEVVFCMGVNPRTSFFVSTTVSHIFWTTSASPSNAEIGSKGYCKSASSTFTSGRKAIMTQVNIRYDSTRTAEQFTGVTGATGKVMVVHATSLIPSLSDTTSAKIDTCLSTYMAAPEISAKYAAAAAAMKRNISQCLDDENVPNITTTSTFLIAN